jgi:pantothenate synthetase
MKKGLQGTQQCVIETLLQICLALGERNAQLAKQNRKLAKELHKEIDYSDRLQKKIDNLKQRNKK